MASSNYAPSRTIFPNRVETNFEQKGINNDDTVSIIISALEQNGVYEYVGEYIGTAGLSTISPEEKSRQADISYIFAQLPEVEGGSFYGQWLALRTEYAIKVIKIY